MQIHNVFTIEEMEKIITAAGKYNARRPAEMWVGLYTVMCNLGRRVTEVLMIRRHDVNFDHATIRIHRIKQRKKRLDTLPMNQAVRDALWPLCQNGGDPEALLFPINRTTVWVVLQKLCKRVGIPPRRAHDLRHSCASYLVQVADLATVRDILGHASISTTSIYVHAINLRQEYAKMKPIGANGKEKAA